MSVSDKPATLRAQMKHHEPIVCFQQNQRDEVRIVGGGRYGNSCRTARNEMPELHLHSDRTGPEDE